MDLALPNVSRMFSAYNKVSTDISFRTVWYSGDVICYSLQHRRRSGYLYPGKSPETDSYFPQTALRADTTLLDLQNPEVIEVVDGHIAAPMTPGLGLEINEALVREAATKSKPWANTLWRGVDGGFREW
jgi:hypothetical protein